MWDKEELWKSICGELEIVVSSPTFNSWIRPCFINSIEPIDEERILVQLACPSPFHQKTVDERHYGEIKKAIENYTSRRCELALVVQQREAVSGEQKLVNDLFRVPEPVEDREMLMSCGLNPKFSFDNFVVGGSNSLAYAAAKGVVDNPGTRHNPLFIYGGVGVGKTHLMHAVGRALLENGFENVRALTSEQFTNDFVRTMRSKEGDGFKRRYRGVDALLIDDIQFIAGKESTQEEFFHTFNDLMFKGKQIIMTADKRPQEIEGMEERLTSRFLGGMTVDIGLPDYEMRLAVLNKKCSELKIEPEEGALDLMANSLNTNSRELEGTLMQLVTKAGMKGGRLNRALVEEELGVRAARVDRKLRPQEVISMIAKQFEFRNKDIVGSSRKADLVRARHVAMYILRKEMGLTLENVARLMGRNDHTTVLHAVEKIDREFLNNQEIREQVMKVKQALYS